MDEGFARENGQAVVGACRIALFEALEGGDGAGKERAGARWGSAAYSSGVMVTRTSSMGAG